MGKCVHTYESVRDNFEQEGYTLLSTEYKNNHTKLNFICSKGHEHSITWNDWKTGYRCVHCSGRAKLTIEYVRKCFEKEGYILLSTEYKNSRTKLDYICPNGHTYFITWSNWSNGSRCLYCSGKASPSIDQVRAQFEFENYVLLSTDYKNNSTKLEYICPNGHKHSTTWGEWQQGTRCLHCSSTKKLTIGYVRDYFEKEGYTLLSTEYKNNKTKLECICPEGHNWQVTWCHFKYGRRCGSCSNLGENNCMWGGGVTADNVPLFKTYAHQINFAESVREFTDEKGRVLLEVQCKYCQEWFVPTMRSVQDRIKSIKGQSAGENNFYCSQECKDLCSVFNAKIYPKGFISNEDLPYTQHELNIWAETVKAKFNYTCEMCGAPATDAHHIKPKKLFPNEALDPENGAAYCHDCHMKYGHNGECSTGSLANIVCSLNSSTNLSTESTESTDFSSTNLSTELSSTSYSIISEPSSKSITNTN